MYMVADMTTMLFFALVAFFAGFINTAFGVGGGVLLISFMPGRIAPWAIVPLHGISILTNNICRSLLDWKSIQWKIVVQFVIGAVLGMLLALPCLERFHPDNIPLLLGCSILVFTWMPRFSISNVLPAPFYCCGFIQTFLAMFVGATGPLVMLFFLNRGLSKDAMIANNAIVNVASDIIKMAGFLSMGFPYLDFIPEMAVLAGGMTMGSFCGKFVRNKFSSRLFSLIIKLLISVLALQMIVSHLI